MLDASDVIPFGEWLPDLGAFGNPGALTASNCLTEGEKYKPFQALIENTEDLPDECVGAFAYRDAVGNVTIFAGTREKLWKLDGVSWVDVTRATGGDYTTADDGFWDFKNYGTLVICTNYNDDIQCFDLSSSTEFELMSATAPRCRRLMVLSNFVIALDIVDASDGPVGYGLAWGPILNPRGDWTPDPTVTQADKQYLNGGDYSITAGVNIVDFGLLVQPKLIWRIQYVGGQEIFRITREEEGRGSSIHRSVISDGRRMFYLDDAGYFMWEQGGSQPIGNKKWNKTLLKLIDQSYSYNINSSIDAVNTVVMMAFPTVASNGGRCNRIFCYNWADQRATLVTEDTEVLFTYLSVGYTLEDIDSLYGSLDSIPFSLDSRFFVGGKTILGAFSSNHKLGAFTGPEKTATIGTPEVRPNTSGKAQLDSIIPFIEGGTKTARVGLRDRLTIPPVWSAQQPANSITDEFDFNVTSTYMRAEIEISGSWEIAHGLSLRAQATGNV